MAVEMQARGEDEVAQSKSERKAWPDVTDAGKAHCEVRV